MKKAPLLAVIVAAVVLGACAGKQSLPPAASQLNVESTMYRIGPGDELNIFVWKNKDLTSSVPVRPDGRVTVPLLEDVVASGKTPTELAREIEDRLGQYVKNPVVTVIVTNFVGSLTEQVRVMGEATSPKAIPYKANMTLLDVVISVGGLTKFAAGNRSTLVRAVDGKQVVYRVRIDDLVKGGDIGANVRIAPGDVIIIPQSYF